MTSYAGGSLQGGKGKLNCHLPSGIRILHRTIVPIGPPGSPSFFCFVLRWFGNAWAILGNAWAILAPCMGNLGAMHGQS